MRGSWADSREKHSQGERGSGTATGLAFARTKNRLTADFSLATEIIGIVTEAVSG